MGSVTTRSVVSATGTGTRCRKPGGAGDAGNCRGSGATPNRDMPQPGVLSKQDPADPGIPGPESRRSFQGRFGNRRTRLSPGRPFLRVFPLFHVLPVMARSLQWRGGMNARKVLDGQPGATPVIRTDGKNVTFRFELVGLQDQLRLALRCDPNGNVWAAIVCETERTDAQ